MPHELLEVYTHRAIAVALKAAMPQTYVVEVGMRRAAPEGFAEWITVDPLAFQPFSARRGTLDGTELFQISCFAKFAEIHPAGALDAPFRLAAQVRSALEKADILVKKYGEASEDFVGTLALAEAGRNYLGEGALGIDYPANVHAVVLTFRGTLNATA